LTSPRDEIDNWLERDVTPLYPPSGSLDRIRRRARQRKTRQATFAAAGCAVVLAAAIVTPQLIAPGQHNGQHTPPPVAIGPSSPAVQPSGSNSATPDTTKDGHLPALPKHSRLSTTSSGTPVPDHFQPTSVTFVGKNDGSGGVVGAVVGQAGQPGHCATIDCTSMAGTSNYGHSWYGVSAPVTPGPAGSAGVSQLRFANLSDGWAYGPALYETSRGGWSWQPESSDGQRVIDVEAAPTRAFAVFGTCAGTGPDYAANCASFSLWTSAPGSQRWSPVNVPPAYSQMMSPASAAPVLVISGGNTPTAYLLTPSGQLLSGLVSGGNWQAVGPAPCKPGPPSTSGQGAASQGATSQGAASQAGGAQLAVGKGLLLLACDSPSASGGFQVTLHASTDGAHWHTAGTVSVPGRPTSLSSAAAGQVVLATTSGIEYSANGGHRWKAAKFASAGSSTAGSVSTGPQYGFSYVGMTNTLQGVAVPENSGLGEIFVTSDGGKTWTPVAVSSSR
jgi:hypothetical protein